MNKLKADITSGDMPLDRRLKDLGIEPEKFQTYGDNCTRTGYTNGG
jgi:hypothetical protein